MTDILCYDYPGKKFRFSIVYNLLSLDLNYRIKVFTKLKEKIPLISTITPLYSGAGWLEREVWDMFGIFFLKNNDLRRILTDYGFVGYPLRKDFPLTVYRGTMLTVKIKSFIKDLIYHKILEIINLKIVEKNNVNYN